MTKSPKYVQDPNVFETGLSDFHKMVVALMKTCYFTLELKTMCYRKYKVYPNDEGRFKEVPVNKLSKVTISKKDELLKILFGFF